MTVRFLFWLMVVLGVLWILKRIRVAARRPAAARSGQVTGRMVRDRICQTFLPEERALRLTRGGETHHFCSPACRERFLAEEGGRRAAATGR
jgi:YHS domain-containing protein